LIDGRSNSRRSAQTVVQQAEGLDPSVIQDVLSWDDDPELSKIRARLLAHPQRKAFLDTYAEAALARHMVQAGLTVRVEVPTPQGRMCDFHAGDGATDVYVHVKRIDTDRPMTRTIAVSSRLRVLEHIARPYIVQVWWIDGATDEQMQTLVTRASGFIEQARVGDALTVRNTDDSEIGGVRIMAPTVDGSGSVQVTFGLPCGFIDPAPRLRRVMERASRQFMPRSENLVIVATMHPDDVADVETALLGSHIERWDQVPPRGRRVAHGRDADAFWHDDKVPESRAAGWFCLCPTDLPWTSRLWIRKGATIGDAERALIGRIVL